MFLQAVRELSPVPIRFGETEGEAKGYYSNKKKEIVVKEDMSESQTIKTLIHEIAHAKLHDREVLEQAGEEKDQRTKEIEAESIAYTVCQYFGLDTSDYSFPYIAGWSENLKMWELRSFMDAIRRTAGEFIKELEGKMKELETDRSERDRIQNEKEIKIGMDTKAVELEQHEGLWHTVEEVEIEKEHFYLMEHNEYGASVAPVLVNGDGKVVAQDLENGLDQEAMRAIREYLEEKEIAKKQEKVETSNASLFEEAEREAAYQIETTGQFFFIQETEEGYDYTFYDQEFQELDGGVYDTFDVTLQEAAKTLLLEEGADLTVCRKIDSEMLQEQVERAEYFPQKSYEALKPLMESEENNIAFRSGYGYVMLQKIPEGYEYIIYDQAFREVGGQFYENITASKEEVVSWIFQEEGMGELPCEPFSYEELKKSVIEGEKKRLYEGKLTPTSQIDIREEELLHGESRQNIEESVLCYAQAELEEAGYEEITLLAARVYGSRTRETLYREDSDLDVVLSYTGDIREDAFFNLLQENGMQIAGLKIDINPISLEKTGTLQEYIKRAEQYLDEREAEKQGRTPQETVQESKISFYAAECMEFPSMGEYYENLTLEEAVEKYKTIPEDRIHGIKGIGFCLKDGSIYDGEYELMSGGKISKDLIDLVPHYKESPLVQKAMRDLERILVEKQRENTVEQAKPEGTMGRKVSVLKALKERKELLKKQEKKEETSHTRKKEAEL
ncbi:MAG: LPD16 domain-containing protein [Mediterraneibacter gnavus]